MADDKKSQELVGFMDAQEKMQGTGVIQVKDGHVFMFKRETLQALLDQNPNAPKIVMFIKHTPKVG